MLFRKDNLKLGLLLGLIGPLIGLAVIYLIKYSASTFSDFLSEFFGNKRLLTSVGSLSLLANVILFTLYVNTHRDSTAKGIFIVTLLYGIAILVLKI